MLYIDGVKTSTRELSDIFGVDLKKIEKQPLFQLDKSKLIIPDKKNPNVFKTNNGYSFRPKFRVRHPKQGFDVEIRYANSKNLKQVGDKTRDEYLPRYIVLEGSKFEFKHDIELALFLFLYPGNTLSPIRNIEKNRKYDNVFEFVDNAKKAIQMLKEMDDQERAMKHAREVSDFDMRLIAKGLGLPGVDSKDDDTLRAEIRMYASNQNTYKKYIEAIDGNVTKIQGRIINLIDRGVLSLVSISGVRQWKWTSGSREGETVGPNITNPTQDAKKAIINYLLSNLGNYNDDILDTTDNLKAKEKAEQFLKSQEVKEEKSDVPDYLSAVNKEESYQGIKLPDANEFSAVRDFVASHGYKKNPAHVKMVKEGILSGDITSENISHFMLNNLDKAED